MSSSHDVLNDHKVTQFRSPGLSKVALIGILLLNAPLAISHPGIGIVRDSRGNIFYTDLKHVWRIAPDGAVSIAVRNVHTHELHIDSDDNLYGEHLWYEGTSTDKWGHRVWMLTAGGILSDVIRSREGFREAYGDASFVRDKQGNSYEFDRKTNAVLRRPQQGPVSRVAVQNTRNVRWMTVTTNGVVFLIDLHDLLRVDPAGSVRTVARDLAERHRSFLFFTNEHAVMGLAADQRENVFVAVAADQTVRKIEPDGTRTDVYRSQGAWAPTGVCTGTSGEIYVLEYSQPAVRVVKVRADGSSIVLTREGQSP